MGGKEHRKRKLKSESHCVGRSTLGEKSATGLCLELQLSEVECDEKVGEEI
jgi:hypothetical protein